jgi:hypothetical protein
VVNRQTTDHGTIHQVVLKKKMEEGRATRALRAGLWMGKKEITNEKRSANERKREKRKRKTVANRQNGTATDGYYIGRRMAGGKKRMGRDLVRVDGLMDICEKRRRVNAGKINTPMHVVMAPSHDSGA